VPERFPYFYSIRSALDQFQAIRPGGRRLPGQSQREQRSGVYPRGDSRNDLERGLRRAESYKGGAEWDLVPRERIPRATKVTFMNLPGTNGTIPSIPVAGDLVKDIPSTAAVGDSSTERIPSRAARGRCPGISSRGRAEDVSGIYLYSVDTDWQAGRQIHHHPMRAEWRGIRAVRPARACR